jgi:hypothetical protein
LIRINLLFLFSLPLALSALSLLLSLSLQYTPSLTHNHSLTGEAQ